MNCISWTIDCPYCGEAIEVLLDPSIDSQNYIEDCQVCCRPIQLAVSITADEQITVQCRREDD